MTRSTPPQFVEVYDLGDNYNDPPRDRWSFSVAAAEVNRGRAQWRNHKRKLVRFSEPDISGGSESSLSALTAADAEALAEAHPGSRGMSSRLRERLQGWGLL